MRNNCLSQAKRVLATFPGKHHLYLMLCRRDDAVVTGRISEGSSPCCGCGCLACPFSYISVKDEATKKVMIARQAVWVGEVEGDSMQLDIKVWQEHYEKVFKCRNQHIGSSNTMAENPGYEQLSDQYKKGIIPEREILFYVNKSITPDQYFSIMQQSVESKEQPSEKQSIAETLIAYSRWLFKNVVSYGDFWLYTPNKEVYGTERLVALFLSLEVREPEPKPSLEGVIKQLEEIIYNARGPQKQGTL